MPLFTANVSQGSLTMELRLPFSVHVAAALCVGGLLLVASLIYSYLPSAREREAYSSLDHLALNVLPPQTEWLNMGWWRPEEEGEEAGVERTFPNACEALARRLHALIEVPQGARVLDVGCASGDGLLLLLREKPGLSILHGVTSLDAHARRARSRLAAAVQQLPPDVAHTQHAVFTDDAVSFLASDSASGATSYDVIFALDCAYHFQTRADFLRNAFKSLAPGGSVVLMDLVASQDIGNLWRQSQSTLTCNYQASTLKERTRTPSLLHRIRYRILLRLAGVPHINMITLPEYCAALATAGFTDVAVQDISDAMFPGFSRFLCSLGVSNVDADADARSQQQAWRGPLSYWTWLPLRAFGSVVASWGRGGEEGDVRSIFVVATKPVDS